MLVCIVLTLLTYLLLPTSEYHLCAAVCSVSSLHLFSRPSAPHLRPVNPLFIQVFPSALLVHLSSIAESCHVFLCFSCRPSFLACLVFHLLFTFWILGFLSYGHLSSLGLAFCCFLSVFLCLYLANIKVVIAPSCQSDVYFFILLI